MSDLKPWWAVFPQGTRDGDEESRFFCALSRHSEFKWRSVDNLADESKLSKSRVEELITKYAMAGMVLQNPSNPDQWGYWERVGAKKIQKPLLDEEHETRFKKYKP